MATKKIYETFGSLAILLAIVLGAIGAGGRQLLSKYRYIFLIKKN